MRRRAGKRQGFWVAAAATALLYTLLALPPLGNDSQLGALGVFKLPEPREMREPPLKGGNDWSAFSNLDSFGFYSPRGIESCFRLAPMAASDGTYLVVPSPELGSIGLYRLPEGRETDIPFAGYPFIQSSRIFLLRQDQQGITEIDGEGKTIWSREFGSTITSASVVASHSAWGTLGGEIIVQNGRDPPKTIRPAAYGLGLAQACIYSVAVSPDGGTIAALCGLDPQFALFFQPKGEGYSLVHMEKLQAASTRTEPAVFSADSRFAVMRTASGLLIYLSKDRRSNLVQADRFGGETEISMLAWGGDRVALLCGSRSGKQLSLIRNGVLEAYLNVDDDASGLSRGYGDSLVVSGRNFIREYGIKGKSR